MGIDPSREFEDIARSVYDQELEGMIWIASGDEAESLAAKQSIGECYII